MSRPAIRDVIIPGSLRTVTLTWDLMMLRCGRCASEFEVNPEGKTARCKGCNRVCRINGALEADPDVIPLRRKPA